MLQLLQDTEIDVKDKDYSLVPWLSAACNALDILACAALDGLLLLDSLNCLPRCPPPLPKILLLLTVDQKAQKRFPNASAPASSIISILEHAALHDAESEDENPPSPHAEPPASTTENQFSSDSIQSTAKADSEDETNHTPSSMEATENLISSGSSQSAVDGLNEVDVGLLYIRSHREEKLFLCKWPGCGKSFARQDECKRHEQLHANYRPFTCDGCNKQFARMDALNRHLRLEGGADCQRRLEANGQMLDYANGLISGDGARGGAGRARSYSFPGSPEPSPSAFTKTEENTSGVGR
ncbi:hypothetical protein FB451DRAFT_1260485 [Mycena latifolia]|nr:hypothetical protein FB451DRAFT_1260485 [Mycena latifolia]